MLDNISNNSIYNKDYDYFSVKNFIGGSGDPIRLIVIIFIFLSFILNVIIINILSCYRKKREFSLSGLLTLNILIVNFLHTLSYIFNWIMKNDEIKNEIAKYKSDVEVGALLKGNPSHFGFCQTQGFFLIFLSLSQDIIIIIFFAFINIEGKEKKLLALIILIFGGYIPPFLITLFFYKFDLIGLNEKFCYISKYYFYLNDKNSQVIYEEEKNYKFFILIIFILRLSNFILTFFFVIKGIGYMKWAKKSDKKREILKYSFPVVLIAIFTLFVDLVFKIMSLFDHKLEEKYIELYIILNSIDSILLPLAFSIRHKIYIFICCCFGGSKYEISSVNENENEIPIKDIEIDKLISENENDKK